MVETSPGIWDDRGSMVERTYYGDLTRNRRDLQTSQNANDNVNVSITVSIVADAYANENYMSIRYAIFNGKKWKVSGVDVEHPRLLLTIGGLFNE